MKLSPNQLDALEFLAEGAIYPTLVKEEDGWYARWRAVNPRSPSVDDWVDEYVRQATMTRLTEDAENQTHETLHDAWMMALRSATGLVRWEDAACEAFARELATWSGSAEIDVAARKGLAFRWVADDRSLALEVARPCDRASFKALGQATYLFAPLTGLRARGDALRLSLTRGEAENFVAEGASQLERAGYTVVNAPRSARVTAVLSEASEEVPSASSPRPRLVVHVAGEEVSAAEIRFLLDQASSLVYFRDRWIEVDRGILREALRALEKGLGRKPNMLSFQLGIGHVGNLEIEGPPVDLLSELAKEGPSYLFPYQVLGFNWLRALTDKGIGALLADDMGLGKTVEAIAYLSSLDLVRAPALVVAPLTLLANWRHELQRFAPHLSVYTHHGENRHLASGFHAAACAAHVVLTSYNLLVKEYSRFAEVSWSALVLDEAQAIKNPDTQVARAVKALRPPRRVALTGTPIENSIQDLWSIEDFLNPGLLGDRASFRTRFLKPLAFGGSHAVAARLRKALERLILRRLKTDPEIAAELGDKREVREYCALGPEERRAYESALAAFRHAEHTPGDALVLLTELKLICDGESKIARFLDLVETIFENDESVLVFTQYAKVGAILASRLRARFARTFPFLHGALSPRAREREIRSFTSSKRPDAFILSLRAGGFGLTLTKATHVIHFDRWWNPAVENQATDRAHRVGQTRDVLVHLLMTEGTVEEHVDELLREKLNLKNLISDSDAFWKAVNLT